jgi:hypothetical protein
MACCPPLPKCCGCIGLREGTLAIVWVAILFGMALVVIHALIQDMSVPSPARLGWVVQLMDLDFSFRHMHLSVPGAAAAPQSLVDESGFLAGILYGTVVVMWSMVVLYGVLTYRPAAVRGGIALLALMAIMQALVFAKKVQVVCDLQPLVFPELPKCPVLKVTYVERTFASILIMMYGATIIHSYASELDDLEWDEDSFAYKDDPYSRAAPRPYDSPSRKQGSTKSVRPPISVGPLPPASNVSSTAPSVYAERAPLFVS